MLGGVSGVCSGAFYGVVRGICNGMKHRGGLMSGVCGLDDDAVEIKPEEILPLALDSLFIEMG
jgi:hypothetical protein